MSFALKVGATNSSEALSKLHDFVPKKTTIFSRKGFIVQPKKSQLLVEIFFYGKFIILLVNSLFGNNCV